MQIVSAEQFVDGLFAALTLLGRRNMNLDDCATDAQFAKAYEQLLEHAEEFDVVPDFTIVADPTYNDSTCLRDAILAVRDLRSVSLRNPRFIKLEVVLSSEEAEAILARSAIPRALVEKMAKEHIYQVAF